MSYVFTDDDYSAVHSVKCQLGMLGRMAELSGEVSFDTEELCSMLAALREPLDKVLELVYGRHKASVLEGAGMGPFDLYTMAQMLSGRGLYRYRDILAMDERLARTVQANPDMKHLLDAWRAAMTDDGGFQMVNAQSTMLNHYAGLVRPLAIAKIERMDAHDVARLYNVGDPAAVAQAIADAANRNAVEPRKTPPKARPKRAKSKAGAAAR